MSFCYLFFGVGQIAPDLFDIYLQKRFWVGREFSARFSKLSESAL